MDEVDTYESLLYEIKRVGWNAEHSRSKKRKRDLLKYESRLKRTARKCKKMMDIKEDILNRVINLRHLKDDGLETCYDKAIDDALEEIDIYFGLVIDGIINTGMKK